MQSRLDLGFDGCSGFDGVESGLGWGFEMEVWVVGGVSGFSRVGGFGFDGLRWWLGVVGSRTKK